MNFLKMLLNLKSKRAIKDTISEIEKKQNKLTCDSNPSEKYEKILTNKIKQKKETLP